MQLEIISNINMDSLKYHLKDYTLLQNCSYGNYMIDLLDKNSSLYTSSSDVVVCFLDFDTLNEDISKIFQGVKALKESGKIIILNTLVAYPSYIDTYTNDTLLREIELNHKIIEFAKEHHIVLLDFYSIVKRYGSIALYDEKYWYLGKIKFSAKGFELIAKEIDTILTKYKESAKKCLVLDLDNTLWGGVVAEDEIKLSNDGVGAIYQEFQKKVKKLKDFGVLVAINSKNNLEDALNGLNHPSSILNKDDFIIIKANWENKNKNIESIAHELNIGEDSLVFIDDNAVERALVKSTTDTVVPDFPSDIYELNRWFIEDVVYPYFYKFQITNEDLAKQTQYRAKLKRDELSKEMNYDTFLQSLDIKLTFYIDDKKYLQRYSQLTQKTNQFNLTTKRYTTQDIEAFVDDKNSTVIAVEYQDKYAKEGIIALAIIEKKESQSCIDTFLLSCRVLKRDVEKSLMQKIESLADDSKVLVGEYIPTKRNIIAKDLYKNLGFKEIQENKYIKDIN
jgi:FkbH-like protein